jgi:hypothetical protein
MEKISMKMLIRTIVLASLGCFFAVCGGVLVAQSAGDPAGSSESKTSPPAGHLQILNGISPMAVTVSINGQPLYPGLTPGARISSFGLKDPEVKISVSKSDSEKKDFTVKFSREGHYTVVLTGDFKPLPPVKKPDGSSVPDFRVAARLFKNEKPKGQTVEVRVVNGSSDRALGIFREKAMQVEVPAEDSGVARDQPAALFLKAASGDWTTDLYLAQEPPAANITIVFWPAEKGMSFRAMTESYEPAAPSVP